MVQRLEPNARNPQISEGIRAEIADPLWLLGRQWQLGEFLGDDAGTPTQVQVKAVTYALRQYRPGAPEQTGVKNRKVPYTSGAVPLETIVEREPPPPATDRRRSQAATAGADFVRLLRAAFNNSAKARYYASAYRQAFGFALENDEPVDLLTREDDRMVDLLVGQVPDGRRLFDAVQASDGVPSQPSLYDEADRAVLSEVVKRWVEAYAAILDTANRASAWWNERLSYSFGLVAGESGEVELEVSRYRGGTLDWYDFDVVRTAIPQVPPASATSITRTMIPTPVSFQGMPNPRWWQFEDARIDFGKLEVEPVDLSRMLLVEFGVVYANDWFRVPITLDVGTLCRIHSLIITNNFGEHIEVSRASRVQNGTWRMFELNGPSENDSLFFLPPTTIHMEHGKALEEVLLLRDEGVNLVWAIESQVEGLFAGRTNRPARSQAGNEYQSEPIQGSTGTERDLRYRVVTDLPNNWFPFVPVTLQSNKADVSNRLLQVAGLSWRPERDAPLKGRILRDRTPYFDEEIPRGGLRVQRIPQLTRGQDGELYVWIERRVRLGGVQGASGLQFDVVDQT